MKQKCFAMFILMSAISTPVLADEEANPPLENQTSQQFTVVGEVNDGNRANSPTVIETNNPDGGTETVIVDMNGNLKVVEKPKIRQGGQAPNVAPTGGPAYQVAPTQPPLPPAPGYAPGAPPPPNIQMPTVETVPPASTTLPPPPQTNLGQPAIPGRPDVTGGMPTTQSLPTVPPASQTLQTPTPPQGPIGSPTLPGFNQAPNAAQPPFNQRPVQTTVQPSNVVPVQPVNPPPGTLPPGSQQTSMAHFSGSESDSSYSEMINGQDNIPG